MDETTGIIDTGAAISNAPMGGNGVSLDGVLKSDAEYRTIFERAMVGIFRSTPDGRILNLNPASARMLGFESPEEAAETIKDLSSQLYVEREDRKSLLGLLEEKGVAEGFETRLYRKDGSIMRAVLNVDCVKDARGGFVCFQGTLQDITKAREAEEKYRKIYENAIEGMFQATPEGRIMSANPAFARILGYDTPEELNAHIHDMGRQVFASDRRRQEYEHLLATQGSVRDFEAQVQCKDGDVEWVTISSRRIEGSGGSPFYYEGAIECITERKKLEAQLRYSQKLESIGTLAGGVAHDFNNVLTTIMGYCSLMLMKAGGNHPFLGYVNQIMEAANRASSLTQSLLAFSRKQAMETKAIEVNEAIRGVEKLLRRIIGEDIKLQTSLCKEKLVVVAGEGQIGQLLMNLATNARDAMPDGGTLTIRTEQVHLSSELVKNYNGKEGTYLALEVADTGSGMDERTKDQVFDPFFTTKEVGKGTGLGLSIVYGIVNQNKGYVDVASVPGKGTTFTVYLPLTETASAQETLPERIELRGGEETILVAEDNSQVREIVTATLSDFGYNVVEAVDGEDAVKKFNESKGEVDILLLDVIMPGKNGKEVYVEIKKARPDIRAIFMSGYTGDILSRKGISREGIPMISKPIIVEKLLREIRQVLDNKPSQLSLFP